MAQTPMMTTPTEKTAAATVITRQSSSSVTDAASREHTAFTVYIVFLVIGALVTAALTVWLYRATGKYQDAVKRDSDTRIAEAGVTAKNAVRDAAQANEATARLNDRALSLERDNLAVRRDLSAETGKVAALQKEAADARTVQQQVEIILAKSQELLAKQQERAALAERALLEMQERVRHRTISKEQRARLITELKGVPKAPIQIACLTGTSSAAGEGEMNSFAQQIREVIIACGWPPVPVDAHIVPGSTMTGVAICVRDGKNPPAHADGLRRAFGAVGITLTGVEYASVPEEAVLLLVGGKP